ncbi:MAG TPA: CBS domain-containing protein [Chitinophagaceae bacterium]|nr:CBS domain-containing protein [Chitinophagaceae bacterium]
MKKVSHILARKGDSVISVSPSATVMDALKLMAEKNIGSLVVMEKDVYKGLMTERDYARKVMLKGKSSADTPVHEIMTTDLPRITPENSIDSCMHIMSENNIRYLPVFDHDKLCGIISIIDVITETILSQKETIEHLQSYIQS